MEFLQQFVQDKGLTAYYMAAFVALMIGSFACCVWGWARTQRKVTPYAVLVCALLFVPGLICFIIAAPAFLSRFYAGILQGCAAYPKVDGRRPVLRRV
jgi:hypothetical protein